MTNLELADKLQKEAEHFSGAQELVGVLWDAGAALRNLHTENTALRVTEDNLRQEGEAILELLAINAELVEALKKISAIELKDFGSDWEEIEEAQEIANAALAKAEGGEL